MKEILFTGSGVAIVTPFHAGAVNFPAFGRLIDRQIDGGTDAIIVCGTTGEAATMTQKERMETIAYCVDRVAGRVPVIAGTGANDTQVARENALAAERLGVDGLLIVTPYYNKATQNGLIAHYTAIAEAVSIPCLLYHVPTRTGLTMKPETIVKLCREVPNIVGVKEASGNFSAIAEIMHLANGCVDLYSGNDDQIVPLLALGGKGVISVLSNVAPQYTHDICAKWFAGETAESLSMQLKAVPLIKALFADVNPIPVKWAMNRLGWNAGDCRLPLVAPSAAVQAQLETAMQEFGLLK